MILAYLNICLSIAEHKHSRYTFTWFIPPGKHKFERGKLWDVARHTIIKHAKPGYLRAKHILKLDRKLEEGVDGSVLTKYSREDDVKCRVLAVMAGVSCKVPLSVFNDVYFRNYTRSLDPKHRPPHFLEINRIIEVMIDGAVLEFTRIVNERRALLQKSFISMTTDFVTDPSRRQCFGVVLLDLVAEKYEMTDGRVLFMSRETAREINENELLSVSNVVLYRHAAIPLLYLTSIISLLGLSHC